MKKTILMLFFCVSFGLSQTSFNSKIMLLDKNATDLVYRLPLNKYQKWLAEAVFENGKKMQFVSVKSLMQVYGHQAYFLKRNLIPAPIKKLYVQDYLNGDVIEAEKAVYLFGSRMVGPHGDDLIPFASEKNAKIFKLKYGGTKILPYKRLTPGLIRYLDM